jgi:hypothetical protein
VGGFEDHVEVVLDDLGLEHQYEVRDEAPDPSLG